IIVLCSSCVLPPILTSHYIGIFTKQTYFSTTLILFFKHIVNAVSKCPSVDSIVCPGIDECKFLKNPGERKRRLPQCRLLPVARGEMSANIGSCEQKVRNESGDSFDSSA